MAIAVVGTPYKAQNTSADPQVFGSIPATTAGNALVACLAIKTGATITVSGITDSAGNTWTRQTGGYVSGGSTRAEIWTATNAASITSLTVDLSAAQVASLILYEVSGYDTTTLIDVKTTDGTASGDAVSDTAWSAGTLTPTAAGNYLLIHALSSGNTQVLSTWTPPAGYTSGGFNTGTATAQTHGAIHQVVTNASGSYGGNVTTNRAATNGFAAVAIREATGGATHATGNTTRDQLTVSHKALTASSGVSGSITADTLTVAEKTLTGAAGASGTTTRDTLAITGHAVTGMDVSGVIGITAPDTLNVVGKAVTGTGASGAVSATGITSRDVLAITGKPVTGSAATRGVTNRKALAIIERSVTASVVVLPPQEFGSAQRIIDTMPVQASLARVVDVTAVRTLDTHITATRTMQVELSATRNRE